MREEQTSLRAKWHSSETHEPAVPARQTAALYLLTAAGLGFLLFRAWFRAKYFDGQPFDGPFQLLNALDRMHVGLIPGRDFPLFHGLGIVYAHYPLYELLGHNLFASEFARELLSPIGWTAAMVALAYAITGSRWMALCALALFTALACLSGVEFSMLHNPIVSQPGHTLIALRWAYPAGCGAALVWAFGANSASLRRAAVAGALFGFAPAWSFEQGSYAVAAALAAATVWGWTTPPRGRALVALAVFILALATVGWVSFFVLSGGDAQAPLQFAFRTIPRNQGWYFGAPPNPSLAVNGMTREVILYLAAAVLLLGGFAITVLRRRHIFVEPRLLIGLAFLTCFALLSGASLSGMLSISYLSPAENAVMIAGIGIGYAILRERPGALKASAIALMLISTAALALAYENELASFRSVRHSPAAAQADPEISGVRPAGIYRSLLPLIERVRATPGATVFSTYRGMLDLATDQPPRGRVDYIIHAFDDDEHRKYLDTFSQGQFTFVHTIRPTYLGYEEWLQTTHWDFYRPLIERYSVVAVSEFSVLWQYRAHPVSVEPHGCVSLTPDDRNRWLIPAASTTTFLQLTANYEIHNSLGSIPIVGGLPRYFLEHPGLANHLAASLNPYHRSTTWLVANVVGAPGWIVPALYSPLPGTRLTVSEITACKVDIPADVAPALAHLLSRSSGRSD